MASYIVEFKQADIDGFTHTKKTYVDAGQAAAAAWSLMENQTEFEYLIVRRVKEKTQKLDPRKETK